MKQLTMKILGSVCALFIAAGSNAASPQDPAALESFVDGVVQH